jgi:ubiquitin C-terminal hydrolase
MERSSRRSLVPAEPGFLPRGNNNNSCYINAAWQLLSSATKLAMYSVPHNDQASAGLALATHLSRCTDCRILGSVRATPIAAEITATVYNNTRPSTPHRNGMGDSHEVITHTLAILERSWPKAAELFMGRYEKLIECLTCHTVSRTVEPLVAIDVPIAKDVAPARLVGWAMQNMHSGEVLSGENSYHCNTCGGKVAEARRTEVPIVVAPYVMLNCLRFGPEGQKITQPVELPARIRLVVDDGGAAATPGPAAALATADTRVCSVLDLHLIAVVVHLGVSQHQGHYVCIARAPDRKRWIDYNDTRVTYCDSPAGNSGDIPCQWYQALYERADKCVQREVSLHNLTTHI